MTDNTCNRARQPFHVRPHRDGFAITGGRSEFDVILAVVFNKGPGSYDHEELAQIMAAAQPVMFPALAQNRNEARRILNAGRADIPADVTDALRRIEQAAASALPVPTIGDLNGTSPLPPAPEAVPADSLVETAKRIMLAHLMSLNGDGDKIPEMMAGNMRHELWEKSPEDSKGPYIAAARAVAGAPDADAADAARYRFLRGRDLNAIYAGGVFAGRTPDNVVLNGDDLDWAVDEAMGGLAGIREPQPRPAGRIPDDAVNAAGRALSAAAGQELTCDPTSYADGTRGYLVANHARGMLALLAQAGWVLRREGEQPQPDDALVEAEREVERLVARFGGEEKWREVSRQLLTWAGKNLPPAAVEGMVAEAAAIASHAERLAIAAEAFLYDAKGVEEAAATLAVTKGVVAPLTRANKAEAGLSTMTAERDAALAQAAALREALKNANSFLKSFFSGAEDEEGYALARACGLQIDAALSTEAAPPTAQGGEGGERGR